SEPALSGITLIRASDSSKVALAKVAKTDDPLSIRAAVPATIAPGGYLVSWRTAGEDGHLIRGSFPFTVGK
ncbi:MAG: copper resistance protein CopC, partial [Gemmatimonadota bacterium]